MMATEMIENRCKGLLALNDDSLLIILWLSNTEEILALERVCSRLRNLVNAPNKSLWRTRLSELADFQAPDLPPDLTIDQLSSTELKDLVTRAIRGSSNWNQRPRPKPTRIQKLDLHNTGLLGTLEQDYPTRVERIKFFARGGCANILWSEGYIQCWNLSTKKCVWTYPPPGDFMATCVIAYDSRYDAVNNCIMTLIVERNLEKARTSHQIKYFEVDIDTGRTRLRQTRSTGFAYDNLVVKLATSSAVIKHRNDLLVYDVLKNRALFLFMPSMDFLACEGTHQYSEDTLILAASVISALKLYAINLRDMLSSNRYFSGSNENSLPQTPVVHFHQLSTLSSFISIPLNEPCTKVVLSPCKPTWRNKTTTSINVIIKLKPRGRPEQEPSHSHFRVFTYSLSPYFSTEGDEDTNLSLSLNFPPRLALTHTSPNVSIPKSHSHCTEDIHSISHGGRAILASKNIFHSSVRLFALSLSQLMEGVNEDDTPRQPLRFGKDLVAPNEFYMDGYSGAIAYVTKDEKTLVVQYFD